jgi:hypothetical protein
VTEAMRGGFTLRVTMIRENRAYVTSQRIDVPWSNKKLTIQWERFVSKLGPADKETWTAIISGPDAERAVAEMVATLYDASPDLDQVSARQNLNETAFFFPHLMADDDGEVKIWSSPCPKPDRVEVPRLRPRPQLRSGIPAGQGRHGQGPDGRAESAAVPARGRRAGVHRQGDATSRPARQTGTVRLTFSDARTGDPVDAALGNTTTDQPFDVPSKESQTYSWRLTVPDGMGS